MLISRKAYEYLLGVYLGDGTPYNKTGIKLTVGKADPEYADLLMSILRPYNPRMRMEYTKDKSSYYYRIFACHPELVKYIRKYKSPYSEKSLWSFPNLLFPEELIAGVFDTDGSTRSRKRATGKWVFEIVIYQRQSQNLKLLLPYFEKLFLYPTYRFEKSNNMSTLNLSHITQAKIFFRQVPIKHPRKRKIISQVATI